MSRRATTEPIYPPGPIPLEDLHAIRRKAEAQLDTFGDGSFVSIRASELLRLVEEDLEMRRWALSSPTYETAA